MTAFQRVLGTRPASVFDLSKGMNSDLLPAYNASGNPLPSAENPKLFSASIVSWGPVAQLGERHNGIVEVARSIRVGSTIFPPAQLPRNDSSN
jgi:hypothetical protein